MAPKWRMKRRMHGNGACGVPRSAVWREVLVSSEKVMAPWHGLGKKRHKHGVVAEKGCEVWLAFYKKPQGTSSLKFLDQQDSRLKSITIQIYINRVHVSLLSADSVRVIQVLWPSNWWYDIDKLDSPHHLHVFVVAPFHFFGGKFLLG